MALNCCMPEFDSFTIILRQFPHLSPFLVTSSFFSPEVKQPVEYTLWSHPENGICYSSFYSPTCLFLLVFFLNYFFWLGEKCPHSFSQCPLLSNNQSVLIFLEGPSSQSGVPCCSILCSSILLENEEQAVPAQSFGMSRTVVSLNSDLISVDVWRDELTHQSTLSLFLSLFVLLKKTFPGTFAVKYLLQTLQLVLFRFS